MVYKRFSQNASEHRKPRPLGNRILHASVFILILYSSYRYPFQINFSGTSPTYSDTPPILQAGKFVIAFSLCALLITFSRMRPVNADIRLFAILFAPVLVLSISKFVLFRDYRFIEPVLWPSIAAIIFLYAEPVETKTIFKFINILFWVALTVDVLQVILFATIGRLPALAYENSVSVRFGSFLDDPNGFSGLCYLFIGCAIGMRRNPYSRFMFWSSVVMILLTQSLTAIGFLILVFLYSGSRYALRYPLRAIAICAVTIAVVSISHTDGLIDVISGIYESKESSINTHTKHSLMDVLSEGTQQYLFGSTRFDFYEPWWNLALSNFGVPWTTFFILIIGYVIFVLHIRIKGLTPSKSRSVYSSLLTFCLFFLFGSFNLPFFIVFPNTFVFFVIALMVIGRKIRVEKYNLV